MRPKDLEIDKKRGVLMAEARGKEDAATAVLLRNEFSWWSDREFLSSSPIAQMWTTDAGTGMNRSDARVRRFMLQISDSWPDLIHARKE
jgi:hypothetical protein